MTDFRPNVDQEERCVNLRWSGVYNDSLCDAEIQQGDERNFWCLKTQLNLGPDGKLVDAYECCPARSCYKQL